MQFPEPLEVELRALLDRCRDRDDEPRAALVPSLRAAQRALGFVDARGLDEIARRLGVSGEDAANLADYFEIQRVPPIARHRIEVCVNIACRRRGGDAVLERCQERLGVDVGEVTADRQVALDEVVCLKLCERGPNLRVDGESVIGVQLRDVDGILDRLLDAPLPG